MNAIINITTLKRLIELASDAHSMLSTAAVNQSNNTLAKAGHAQHKLDLAVIQDGNHAIHLATKGGAA